LFPDLAIRLAGTFYIKCFIVSMDPPVFDGIGFSPQLVQELITDPIEVYQLKLFPKQQQTMTTLSKALRIQGLATCGTWYQSLQFKK
jgi:hypothetical protein